MSVEPSLETLIFDGSSATIHVEWLKGNCYPIVGPEIAIVTEEYACGDVVEAVRNDENALVVKRCIRRGNYRTLQYCLLLGWHEKSAMKKILDKVEQCGGLWEGIFGGVLLIALPPEIDYDPSQDINNAMAEPA